MRLQKGLNKIISTDQVGYINGRYMGTNIRTIADVLNHCKNTTNEQALIAMLDFEKAFDSVKWSFMYQCLKKFNFGSSFISWVKTIYTDIESCVTNNGFSSNFFKLNRGIRQGCCLSALLFIIVAEVLAINLRCNSSIHGILIEKHEFKICQLADDTMLFLKDICSLKAALSLLQDFSIISGLKLNKSKTEVFPININSNLDESIGISCKKDNFKTLGVWFCSDELEMIQLNLQGKIEEMKNTLNMWNSRNMTIFGRVMVLKTLVLSKIINICSVIHIPDSFIKKVDALFFEFVWGKGKRPKVKRQTAVNDKSRGGIKMIEFKNMVTSLKAMWVKRLLVENTVNPYVEKWKILPFANMGLVDKNLLLHKLDPAFFRECRTKFYRDILDSWFQFFAVAPNSLDEILHEKLTYNKYITVGGKVIEPTFSVIKRTGITSINQLIHNQAFLSKINLEQRYNCRLSDLNFNALISAIPSNWKLKIKMQKFESMLDR